MRTPAATPEPLHHPTSPRVPRIAPASAVKTCAGRIVGVTPHSTRSGPAQAQPPATTGPVQATPPARLLGTRGQWPSLLCLAILLVDQASKAVQPAGTFVVNTGGAAILPSQLGDVLWKSQTFGAACDTVDTFLLLAALGIVRKLTNTWERVAATTILAGLLSNLIDRLASIPGRRA